MTAKNVNFQLITFILRWKLNFDTPDDGCMKNTVRDLRQRILREIKIIFFFTERKKNEHWYKIFRNYGHHCSFRSDKIHSSPLRYFYTGHKRNVQILYSPSASVSGLDASIFSLGWNSSRELLLLWLFLIRSIRNSSFFVSKAFEEKEE